MTEATFVLEANTADQAIREVVRYFTNERQRLARLADLTTGVLKKGLLAQEQYASRQAQFWAAVEVQPLPTPS